MTIIKRDSFLLIAWGKRLAKPNEPPKGDAENPFQSRQTTENGFPVFDLLKNRT